MTVRRTRLAAADGFLTVQHVAAVALLLVLVTVLANLIVVQYGRAVVRTALDDAVRSGARITASPERAVAVCAEVTSRARADVLAGAMAAGVRLACGVDGDRVVATATGAFRGWVPGMPDWDIAERASAVRETAP